MSFILVRVFILNMLLKPSELNLPADSVTWNNLKSIATFIYYIYLYEVTANIAKAWNKLDDQLFEEHIDPVSKQKTYKAVTKGDASVVDQLMDLGRVEKLFWENESLWVWASWMGSSISNFGDTFVKYFKDPKAF